MIFEHDSAGTMACQKPQSGLLAALAAILACAATLMLVAPASAGDDALRRASPLTSIRKTRRSRFSKRPMSRRGRATKFE